MRQQHYAYIFIGIVVTILLLPILDIIVDSFYNIDNINLLFQSSIINSLINSLELGLSVATATTLIGISLGILFSKTTLPYSTLWIIILLIPLLIPPYILAYGWYMILGREGILGDLLFGFWGTAWILFSVYLPIPILLTIFYLRQINPKLEEAGLLICSWSCVIWKITLPLIRPAIYFSFLLVFILTISELSVANFLHFDIFPMQSFIQFSAFYDFTTATIYAMPLLVIVIIIAIILKNSPLKFQSYNTLLIFPIKNHYPLTIAIIFLTILIVGVPLWGLISWSSLYDFIEILRKASIPILHSIIYATIGTILLTLFGFISATTLVYKRVKGAGLLEFTLIFLFILSSIVVGIGLIIFWNTPYTNIIYTTPIIIFLGYLSKYLFLTTKIIEIRVSQIPQSLLEMAELTGASYKQILYYIILPLSKESIFISSIIGFIFILRESTITMLVAPAGSTTLPIYTLTQMANGKPSTITSLSILMIFIVIIPIIILIYYIKRKKTKYD